MSTILIRQPENRSKTACDEFGARDVLSDAFPKEAAAILSRVIHVGQRLHVADFGRWTSDFGPAVLRRATERWPSSFRESNLSKLARMSSPHLLLSVVQKLARSLRLPASYANTFRTCPFIGKLRVEVMNARETPGRRDWNGCRHDWRRPIDELQNGSGAHALVGPRNAEQTRRRRVPDALHRRVHLLSSTQLTLGKNGGATYIARTERGECCSGNEFMDCIVEIYTQIKMGKEAAK